MDMKSTVKLSDLPGKPDGQSTAAELPRCTIVMQPEKGRPEAVQVPLSEGATVQTVLDQSKAMKRFRRMNVYVLRKPAMDGKSPREPQKMSVEFKRSGRQVEFDHDYALHPNDRIVVEENTSSMVDDMVGTMADALGIPVAKNLFQ